MALIPIEKPIKGLDQLHLGGAEDAPAPIAQPIKGMDELHMGGAEDAPGATNDPTIDKGAGDFDEDTIAPTPVVEPTAATHEARPGADAAVDVEGDIDPTKETDERRFPVTEAQTVSGQITGLLDKDSAYLEGGQAAGERAAAGRGLMNSTMGVQAGESARIGAAMPIAQQDAATFAQRAESKLGGQQALEQISAGGVEDRKSLKDRYGYEQGMSEQEHIQRLEEMAAKGDIDAKNELQKYKQSAALQKQGHLEGMVELALTGDINSRLQLEQFGYDFDLSVEENIHRLEQLAAQGDINARLALIGFDIQTMLNEQTHGQVLELEDVRLQASITILGEQLANQLQLDAAGQEDLIEQMNLAHANNLEAIGLEGGIRMQQQYLANIAQINAVATQAIAQILSTEGLTPEQQANAVRYIAGRVANDIEMLGQFFSQSDYFDWADFVPDPSNPVNPDFGGPTLPPDPGIPPPGDPNLPPAPGDPEP